MRYIDRINSNIPRPVNRNDPNYLGIFGVTPFTPNVTILDPSDFNCGAIANELEFVNLYGTYFIDSMDPNQASGTELETLINSLVSLPRRGTIESDVIYLSRFKALVTEKTNAGRQTKWAIKDALSYFIDPATIDILEFFDSLNLYFQVRIAGVVSYEDIMFLDSLDTGYLDNNFLGGIGVGAPITYISEIINRIKAAGVRFDIYLVTHNVFTTTIAANIGSVQKYFPIAAKVKVLGLTTTTTIAATVV